MLRTSFEVDGDHLAYRLWFSHAASFGPQAPLTELRRSIRSRFDGSAALDLFDESNAFRAINPLALRNQGHFEIVRDRPDVIEILNAIALSRTFRDQYAIAAENMKEIAIGWKRVQAVVEPYITELSGFNSGDAVYRILILPTEFNEGSYLGDKVIEWGYPEIYPTYNIVGIAHEILHGLADGLASSNDEKWWLHALIYLLADEELRIKLVPQSIPFDPAVMRHYDNRLTEIALRISGLSAWRTRTDHAGLREIFGNVCRELSEESRDWRACPESGAA